VDSPGRLSSARPGNDLTLFTHRFLHRASPPGGPQQSEEREPNTLADYATTRTGDEKRVLALG
jgi:hypothetical protein